MPTQAAAGRRRAGVLARLRKRWSSLLAIVTAIMLLTLVVLAVIGPIVWGGAADRIDTDAVLQGPSSAHLLGTDNVGRDVFARVMVATRASLLLALAATTLGALAGVTLGAMTAVVGTRMRRFLGWVINLALAFPALLVAIFFSVILGAGAKGAVLAIALAMTPVVARLTQTLAASVSGTEYVAAASVLGLRRTRILTRHVLPNIAEPLLLNVAVMCGSSLVVLSGLSFLGLGVQAPSYDWGLLLNQGLSRIYVEPLAASGAGIAIIYAGVAFQLTGEVLAGQAARRQSFPRVPRLEGAGPSEEGARDKTVTGLSDVLRVEDLRVDIPTSGATVHAVRGVSFSIRPAEIVGVVGESGSGKSTMAMAVADLMPEYAQVLWRSHRFLGRPVGSLTVRRRRAQLATGMAMIFQNPASSLNPAVRLGTQLTESSRVHRGLSRAQAVGEAEERLENVALSDPRHTMRVRPFQLSGGMRQRVMIAMGLMVEPRLLIADEPTTALDVVVQRQILDLLAEIREESGTAVLFVSHDLAVVAELCDRVLVMYGGLIVESLPADRVATEARHPYTRALVDSAPDLLADRQLPLRSIGGIQPDPMAGLAGCPFQPRCAMRQEKCEENPPLLQLGDRHEAACWFPVGPRDTDPTMELERTHDRT